jgi:acyl-CoA thioesterase-1
VVLVGMEAPPNLGPRYTSEFRRVFPELAERNGARLIPFLLAGVAGTAEFNQPDGIHPNEEGARRVAETVWKSLREELEEPGGAPVDSSDGGD